MLVQYEMEYFSQGIIIDWDNSIFVGDRPEDEECARRADIEFIPAEVFFNREPENE
jgi:histidinol phosphatase-like enzyme